jgi:predicted NAD-dependent protein-ADP-ribosyltransferase YbiA (DUF1768 family)
MAFYDRTYRVVDGERIEGTWRPGFIKNGRTYFLTDLKIYADGVVDCWGLVTFDEFVKKVRSGWVATALPEGGKASARGVATWTFHEPEDWVDEDSLIGEVADEIDKLAGRPDSTDRCMAAVDVYLADQSETNRAALREAYLAIPEHLRMFALGDQDGKDRPLVDLAFDNGEESRQSSLAYFAERKGHEHRAPADGPEQSIRPSVIVPGRIYHGGPEDPGFEVLQNSYPAPVTVAGLTFPTVTHAYWALSTFDLDQRALVAAAEDGHRARELAQPQIENWADVRLAVMAGLLRAKFQQNPHLAEVLLSTGDARLVSYEYFESSFWGTGSHWVARLLEVVRAELAAERAGISW